MVLKPISLAQGSGGRQSQRLVRSILESTGGIPLSPLEDCALLEDGLAMTIDGYTVTPLSFPGGHIGKLAVCGTVNDLACRGAKPLYLALSVIAEEGFEETELLRYLADASDLCGKLGIRIVTGDTKVVPKGHLDQLVLTTCGIGRALSSSDLGIPSIKPGDSLLLTGPIGLHGATIAALRYDLKSEGLSSDCAPLWETVEGILTFDGLRAMRDCTRGGLSTVLCEWAEASGLGLEVDECAVTVTDPVASVCDLLGFDPFSLACEGCLLLAVSSEDTEPVLEALRKSPHAQHASRIGTVTPSHPRWVSLNTSAGGSRVLDMPAGEILPRIC
jgi:hydrogenase expression/formation protein HypE